MKPAEAKKILRHSLILLCATSVWLTVACREVLLFPSPPTPIPEITATAAPTPQATVPPYSGAGFDTFLSQLESSLLRDRPSQVTRYIAGLSETPLTDGNRAIFLWQGNAQSVVLAGDMNNWEPGAEPTLRRIDGTDLWVGEGTYETNARLDYKFVVDGTRWELDPLNERVMQGGFGPNSELAMPAYTAPAEVAAPVAGVPRGILREHTLESEVLSQRRTFYVYTPPSEIVGEKLPSVYIHDGGEYISLINTPALLDQLIARGAIAPLVAVFIPPVERNLEYAANEAYVRFVADELVPFVQENYATDPDPARTGNAGASLGGLLSVYAALVRPDVFGLAAGYSGAYSMGGEAIIDALLAEEKLPLRFYLVVGTYETAIGGNPREGNLLAANRRLADALADRSYAHQFEEVPQGHSWGLWRDYLGPSLQYLYPR